MIMRFPIDLSEYKALRLKLSQEKLDDKDKEQLKKNIKICRAAIIFMTGYAAKKGLGGHTGGAYDIVPEMLIVDGFMRHEDNNIYQAYFDEAGHRVALQYLMSVLNSHMPAEQLLKYREYKGKLPGHPEKGLTPGITFSSGRLGHMWGFINGIALANPDKKIVMFGSDGSQQEGNDAESARFAVAKNLNITLMIDDNDVTIAGHPHEYMKGFELKKTLEGHGIKTDEGDGEDIDQLYSRIRDAFSRKGISALINKRKMGVNIEGIEGTPKGHDAISPELAIRYLKSNGFSEAAMMIETAKPKSISKEHLGSSDIWKKNRSEFGKIIVDILSKMNAEERKKRIRVFDNDLEGSTGIKAIHEKFPEIYISGGIMERNNLSSAAGFGSEKGKQGIFATFSAFLEMVISELTMARLNDSNVLAHFSHAGVDEMADNTCHFGINNFFGDNGLKEKDKTRLYFPADSYQMKAMMDEIFWDEGLRLVFSTRSAVPQILDEKGKPYFGDGYSFRKDRYEVIREGKDGIIVSYGEMLYRALDAVERLRKEGLEIGLINTPTLNVPDEEMLKRIAKEKFVLVVESQNEKTGLGIRFGTWLIEAGFKGKYYHIGTTKPGIGGQEEQIEYQGLDPEGILKKVKTNIQLI